MIYEIYDIIRSISAWDSTRAFLNIFFELQLNKSPNLTIQES